MEKLDNYNIEFKGLKDGNHSFEYVIDDSFFKLIEGTLYDNGKVVVDVDLKKSTQMLVFSYTLKGSISTICDNCLEPMDQPVDFTYRTFVKFGPEYEELEDDDIVIIPHEEHKYNIASTIYDLIVISQPIRHLHPLNEEGSPTCDPDMIEQLSNYLVNDSEVDLEDDEVREIDPRWSELKKLLDNNNN